MAKADIDELRIVLSVEDKDATSKLDAVVAKVQSIKTATKTMAKTKAFDHISSGAERASKSMNKLNGVVEEVSRTTEKLNTSTGLSNIASQAKSASDSMKEVVTETSRVKKATEQASNAMRLGDKVEAAINSVGNFATTIKGIDTGVLVDTWDGFMGKVGSGLSNLPATAKHAFSRLQDVASFAIGKASTGASRLVDSWDNFRASGDKTAIVASKIGGAINAIADRATSVGTRVSSLKTNLGGVASALNPISIGKTIFGALRTGIEGAVGAARKLVPSLLSASKTALKLASIPFKPLINGMNGIVGKVTGLGKALLRMAKLRILRGIVKSVIAGLREGITNAYQWANIVGNSFSSTMDRLATSSQYLKNSLGAMAMPILNALAPVLDTLTDKVVTLLNFINQLIARLTGASGWTKAVKVAKNYGGQIEGAAGSAEKLKEELLTILGIDELNIMDSAKDSSPSGGGGGGAGATAGEMFEEAEFSKEINNFAKMIKDAWKTADFTEVGELIGEKLNGALESIPWTKIKTTAGKVGKSLATFLNGILNNESLFPTMGKTIAEALNTGLEFAYKFVTNFDFKKFGKRIGEAINSAVETFDWAKAGFTTGTWVKGLLDILTNALQNTDWKKLGKSVATFIANIDWAGIISSGFAAIGSLAGAVAGFAAGLFDDVKKAIQEWFNDKAFTEDGEFTITGLLDGIWEGIKNIGTWIYDNIWVPFRDGFKKAFGIASPSKKMKEFGGDIIDGLLEGLSNIWESVKGIFSGLVEKIGAFFKDPIGTIKVAVDKGVEKAKELWDGFKNSEVVKTLKEKGKEAIEKGKEVWDSIKNSSVVKTLQEKGSKAIEGAKGVWDGIKNSTVVKTLQEKGSKVIEGAKGVWDSIKDSEAVKTLSEKGGSVVTKFLTNTWNKLTDNTATKTVKGDTAESYNKVSTSFLNFKDGSAVKTIKGLTAKSYSSIKNSFAGFKDEDAVKTIKGKTGASYTTVKDRFEKVKSEEAVKSILSKMANQTQWEKDAGKYNAIKEDKALKTLESAYGDKVNWDKMMSEYTKMKNDIATKTVKGETAESYKTVKTSFSKFKNEDAVKTIKGLTGKSYTTVRNSYSNFKNEDAVKTIKGLTAKSYTTIKDSFAGLKNGDAVKTIKGEEEKTFSSVKTTYDSISSKFESVGVKALLNSSENKLTGDKKPSVNTTASLNTAEVNWKTKGFKPSVNTTATLNTAEIKWKKANWKPSVATTASLNSAVVNWAKKNWKPSVSTIASLNSTKNALKANPKVNTTANLNKAVTDFKTTPKISVIAKIDKTSIDYVPTVSVKGNLTNVAVPKAKGGAFYNNVWHNIPQYAGGTLSAGSTFIAGEAGPELVGHIGGKTEVLNQSQLAATMAASMQQANSPQNALLREQNALLREMIDGQRTARAVVTTADLVSGFQQMNRRDGRTVVPIGV